MLIFIAHLDPPKGPLGSFQPENLVMRCGRNHRSAVSDLGSGRCSPAVQRAAPPNHRAWTHEMSHGNNGNHYLIRSHLGNLLYILILNLNVSAILGRDSLNKNYFLGVTSAEGAINCLDPCDWYILLTYLVKLVGK